MILLTDIIGIIMILGGSAALGLILGTWALCYATRTQDPIDRVDSDEQERGQYNGL